MRQFVLKLTGVARRHTGGGASSCPGCVAVLFSAVSTQDPRDERCIDRFRRSRPLRRVGTCASRSVIPNRRSIARNEPAPLSFLYDRSMALVVFLRGVNVGGHRTFRPSVLARELS